MSGTSLCLRHRNDWGAILLVDERFIEKANPKCPDSKKISRWVRNRLVRYNDHQSFLNALSHFVDEKINDDQLKPVKKEIVIDLDDESVIPSPSSSTSNRSFITPNPNRKSARTGSNSAFGV
uniref:ATP-dependent helicase C-terminal domain-containing protein n=1 Tax=Panagrolaimus superbus TaxID=310955 RepID=A0A914Z7V3_9BILA